MPALPRGLARLARLCQEDAEAALQPEEVRRALELVRQVLTRGLPDKGEVYAGTGAVEALTRLSSFYVSSGEEPGEGDRLYREEVLRLAHGLADVADRLRLSSAVREARNRAGFSIRELARFSGVDHSYISRVERGAVPKPSRAVMERLASPLGMESWPGPEGLSEAIRGEDRPSAGAGDGTGTGAIARAGDAERPGPNLAELGLHREAVRNLLRAARDLPDEHLELLETQARAMRRRSREKPGLR